MNFLLREQRKSTGQRKRWDIGKFDTVLFHLNWRSLRRKYISKIPTAIKAWSFWPKTETISGILDAISPAGHSGRKSPRRRYARAPQAMAQFVLKNYKNCPISWEQPEN